MNYNITANASKEVTFCCDGKEKIVPKDSRECLYILSKELLDF